MRMAAATARRQKRTRFLTERLRQAPPALARVARELNVACTAAGTELRQPKRSLARHAAVEELYPREVVEVPVGAGHEVSRWEGGRRPAIRARLRTARVDVRGALGPPRIGAEFEQAVFDRRQQAAERAAQPAWERRNRDAGRIALGH